MTTPRIAISLGDPCGIGPEVVARALAARPGVDAVVYGDAGVLARAAAAEAALDDLGALRHGRLSIHASQTIASYWLPPRLVRYRARYPGVTLDIRIGNTREAVAAVREGAADLGLVEGGFDDPLIGDVVVGSDRLVLVVRPDHPWAADAPLPAGDLAGGAWIVREPGSGTRSAFEAGLREVGLDPERLKVVLTLPSNEAVLAAVAAGGGVAAVSWQVAAAAVSRGALAIAPLQLPARSYRLLRHRERYRTRAAEAFAAMAMAPDEAAPRRP